MSAIELLVQLEKLLNSQLPDNQKVAAARKAIAAWPSEVKIKYEKTIHLTQRHD